MGNCLSGPSQPPTHPQQLDSKPQEQNTKNQTSLTHNQPQQRPRLVNTLQPKKSNSLLSSTQQTNNRNQETQSLETSSPPKIYNGESNNNAATISRVQISLPTSTIRPKPTVTVSKRAPSISAEDDPLANNKQQPADQYQYKPTTSHLLSTPHYKQTDSFIKEENSPNINNEEDIINQKGFQKSKATKSLKNSGERDIQFSSCRQITDTQQGLLPIQQELKSTKKGEVNNTEPDNLPSFGMFISRSRTNSFERKGIISSFASINLHEEKGLLGSSHHPPQKNQKQILQQSITCTIGQQKQAYLH